MTPYYDPQTMQRFLAAYQQGVAQKQQRDKQAYDQQRDEEDFKLRRSQADLEIKKAQIALKDADLKRSMQLREAALNEAGAVIPGDRPQRELPGPVQEGQPPLTGPAPNPMVTIPGLPEAGIAERQMPQQYEGDLRTKQRELDLQKLNDQIQLEQEKSRARASGRGSKLTKTKPGELVVDENGKIVFSDTRPVPDKPRKGKFDDATIAAVADDWENHRAQPTTQEMKAAASAYIQSQGRKPPRVLGETQWAEVGGHNQALYALDDIAAAYEKVKAKVGPIDFPLAELQTKLPGVASQPEFIDFMQTLRAAQNVGIKSITGAAMSEQEAQRILTSMASGTLKPGDFEAALATMKRNATRNRDALFGYYGSKDKPGSGDAEWIDLGNGVRARVKRK